VRILGLDPGGTTGIVLVDTDDWTYDAWEIPVNKAWGQIWDLLVWQTPDLVSIEQFIVTVRTATLPRQSDATDLIGWAKGLAKICKVPLVSDSAGNAKAAWSNERLSMVGLRVVGDHARDAMRHALLGAQKHGKVPPLRPRPDEEGR